MHTVTSLSQLCPYRQRSEIRRCSSRFERKTKTHPVKRALGLCESCYQLPPSCFFGVFFFFLEGSGFSSVREILAWCRLGNFFYIITEQKTGLIRAIIKQFTLQYFPSRICLKKKCDWKTKELTRYRCLRLNTFRHLWEKHEDDGNDRLFEDALLGAQGITRFLLKCGSHMKFRFVKKRDKA